MTAALAEMQNTTPTGSDKNTSTGFPEVSMLDRTCSRARSIKTAKQLKKAGFNVGIKIDVSEYKGDKTHYQVVYW